MTETTHIRILRETRRKLKLLAAKLDKTMQETLEWLVSRELKEQDQDND